MLSSYERNLRSKVFELSENKFSWESAVMEWEIFDHEEDYTVKSICVCGNIGLRYLFTIRNRFNGNQLFPIGSSCINKFERDDLDAETTVLEKLYHLYHAYENGEFITLSSEYFSRNLIVHLYENEAFEDNQFNNYNAYNDCEFLLKMFNRRDKELSTDPEKKKIKALIMVIREFLRVNFAHRVRYE